MDSCCDRVGGLNADRERPLSDSVFTFTEQLHNPDAGRMNQYLGEVRVRRLRQLTRI
jgi:hypothetical protein